MKDWVIAQSNEAIVQKITRSVSISRLLARLLANRGMTDSEDAAAFLYPELSKLHNPFLLPQMDLAVNRVKQAINNNEQILIYGNYDADGLTGTALIYAVLRKYTNQVTTYIPNRLIEGYGLNLDAIQLAKEKEINLLLLWIAGLLPFLNRN